MDMLRFHKFTIGANWIGDYGSSEDFAGFTSLLAYSPIHNVKDEAKYPPVLIVTSDHDDRVFPAHSYKYGAAMQQAVRGRCDAGPVFMRIERDAGHGGSTPINKWIEEWSDEMGFALHFMP
jgi:prolyl oligopeptidase